MKASPVVSLRSGKSAVLDDPDDDSSTIEKQQIFTVIDSLFQEEKTWLADYPQSNEWNQISERVAASKLRAASGLSTGGDLRAADLAAKLFLLNEQEVAELQGNKYSIIESGGKIGKKIAYEILDEIVVQLARVLIQETLNISKSALNILNRSIVRALTNETEQALS
jgi:hypothetical protein